MIQSVKKPNNTAHRATRLFLLLLVGLPSLAILAIVLSTGINNEKALNQQARQLLQNRTAESAQYAQEFLQSIQQQVQISHQLFDKGVLTNNNTAALENYYIAQLETYPVIAGIYSSDLEGNFFYVSRSIEASKGKYRVKVITRTNDQESTQVWWRGALPARDSLETLPADGYDSRERPWFKEAVEKRAMIWTDPYVFFTTQKLGVTIAVPFLNTEQSVTGALGVDVELTELAEFLTELDNKRYGSSFIVTDSGTFIAAPAMKNAQNLGSKLGLQSVEKSTDERVKLAYDIVSGGENQSFTFDSDNYLVESQKLTLEQSVPWHIVSFARQDGFLNTITKNNQRNAVLAGIISLLAVIFGLQFAKLLSRPVYDLEDQANHDQLTGLYNRNYLNNHIDDLLESAQSLQQDICFAIVDLDHFKVVNDTYGHAFGDEVLKIFALRLQNQLREKDVIIRMGGEEFLLIMPNTQAEGAYKMLTDRGRRISSQPYHALDKSATVTFSAGLVQARFSTLENHNFQEIYQAADQALYSAKESGRAQVVIV